MVLGLALLGERVALIESLHPGESLVAELLDGVPFELGTIELILVSETVSRDLKHARMLSVCIFLLVLIVLVKEGWSSLGIDQMYFCVGIPHS
jgi:hypothetical protein